MQEQADGFVPIVADRAQAFGLGMGRVVQTGGVLDAKHDGMRGGTLDGGLDMRGEQVLRRDAVVVQEAVGGFGLGPGAAGLRDRRGRLEGEVRGHGDQAGNQTLIAQRGAREFVRGPVGGGSFGRCIGFKHPSINYITC